MKDTEFKEEGLFLNGVYSDVLEAIIESQKEYPHFVFFLQPHHEKRIVKFAENKPSFENPYRVFLSTENKLELNTVTYICNAVGWEDKHTIDSTREENISSVVKMLQKKTEPGVFKELLHKNKFPRNLIYIISLKKLKNPFSVKELTTISTGGEKGKRTTPGGWTYVKYKDEDWLKKFI